MESPDSAVNVRILKLDWNQKAKKQFRRTEKRSDAVQVIAAAKKWAESEVKRVKINKEKIESLAKELEEAMASEGTLLIGHLEDMDAVASVE